MRILHVIPNLEAGGAERALTHLVTKGARQGVSHHIVCLMSGGFFEEEVRAAGVPVTVLGGHGAGAVPRWIIGLRRAITASDADIVQGWMYYANILAYVALGGPARPLFGRNRKLVWGIRCSDMDVSRYPAHLRRVISLGARTSGGIDTIIANAYAGKTYHEAIGYDPGRFQVIPNGFDTERYRPDTGRRREARKMFGIPDGQFTIGIVARVDPMKDYGLFLDIARAMPGSRFIAIGSGTEALAGPDNVTGLGRRSDVEQLMPGLDVLVSTSAYGEGMSNSIGEAMACGLPVVATDVGDARRMLTPADDATPGAGFITRPGDLDGMTASLTALSQDPSLRAKMGECGRQLALERYSIAANSLAYTTLYTSLLSRHRVSQD